MALHDVLMNGRPERGMPPPAPALSETQRDRLSEYFTWLNENRSDVMTEWEGLQADRNVNWFRLDWWEFR